MGSLVWLLATQGCAPASGAEAAVPQSRSADATVLSGAPSADAKEPPSAKSASAAAVPEANSPSVHPRQDDVDDPPLETEPSTGWIGISMKQTDEGVVVASALRSSPAAAAGLHAGDRLVSLDARAISTPSDVGEYVQGTKPGTRITFHVQRGAETRLLPAIVEAKPDREVLLRRELVGQAAPSLSELRTVQGAVVPSWSQLRGHVVLLEFWASWCVACRALAPTLNQWHEELGPFGVHVLGITMDPYEEAARASEHLDFPTFCDENGEVTTRYQGTALPTLVLVDKNGVVVDVMAGLNFERLAVVKAHAERLARRAP